MKIFAQEHYDLMIQFEREHAGRFDKEAKEFWPKGIVYQDGHINELFLAYRRGYAFCEADMRSDIQNLEASRDGYRADAERDALDAARWRFIRRKLCLTGNGNGTCAMYAINLPASIPGWPEPGPAVAEFCDAAIDAAMAKEQA